MKKAFSLFLFILCPFLVLRAQNSSLEGQLADPGNQPLIGAFTVVLNPADSSVVKGGSSNADGNFRIENIPDGNYIIRFSYVGFDDLFMTREISGAVSLGKITLSKKVNNLKEINILGAALPVKQLGDTTQISAGAFKTNPDANAEDLITKMPGITVQNGKVQAQGEDVQKVYVDGKEFFGDDANAVLKNLPSDVIDKIQVFDKKSDQSILTGFDDGNTSKTINIVTKSQFRNGTFGKVYGGYGYEDKWRGGLNLNFFKDNRRITILANTNNINEQNFSSEDLLGVLGSSAGGGRSGGRGGRGSAGGGRQGGQSGDAGNFLVDQKSGITTTNSLGINYANQWKKVELTGSYFVNFSNNKAVTDLHRQYITSENLLYNENEQSSSENVNHRFNFKFQWKPDSANTFLFQPKVSLQQNKGNSAFQGENTQSGVLLSNTSNQYASNLTGLNISAPINYRHAFKKKGRSISVNAVPGYNQNEGDNTLASYARYYTDTMSADEVNQIANLDVQGLTFSSNVAYTEPVNKNSQLMFNYGTNYNQSQSNKETYNVTDSSENIFDPTLSNRFTSNYLSQSVGVNYRYQEKKWNASAGVAYQYAQLDNDQVFPNAYTLHKTFNSILPSARLQYKFTNKKTLNVNYRSSNSAPSVSQLQNVIDNRNPLQLTTGNPDLKQNWQNSLTFRYSAVNTEKSTSFFALLSGTATEDYIVNSTYIASQDTLVAPGIVLSSGSQISRPVNMDGYFNARSFNNYSFPITKIKSNLNLNLGATYTRTPGMINTRLNYANSYNLGFGIGFSSNISKDIDFSLSSNTNYNNISNTLQSGLNSNYLNQNTRFKMQAMVWKGLVLQTDLNHQYNIGLSQNFNQNYLLWNAAIGYKFLKDRKAEIRLSVFDILKQNTSITRNTTETYYEDVQSNVLQRYAMLTFTYNIKYFKEKEVKK